MSACVIETTAHIDMGVMIDIEAPMVEADPLMIDGPDTRDAQDRDIAVQGRDQERDVLIKYQKRDIIYRRKQGIIIIDTLKIDPKRDVSNLINQSQKR
jgi:hypothetical protein